MAQINTIRPSLPLAARGSVSAGAAASKLESQQPLSRIVIAGRSKLPFSGGSGCQAGEIPAWAGSLQGLLNHIARAIDGYANRDFNMAVNRFTGAAWNVGNLFM